MATNSRYVAFDASTNTYSIAIGASVDDVQDVIGASSPGSTLVFAAGTHVFTDQLSVTRGDITLKGAGSEKTTFLFDFPGTSDDAMSFVGSDDSRYSGTMTAGAKKGAYTIALDNVSGLKPGDMINIQQENTDAFLREQGWEHVIGTSYQDKLPQHETLAQIKSINGNKVTLETPVLHDMDSNITHVTKVNALHNIRVEGIRVSYDLPKADWDDFSSGEPDYEGSIAMYFQGTVGAELRDVAVVNAPGHHIEFRTSLSPHIDGYFSDGAHNKGPTGDGYGLQITETHNGVFENMEILNVRHAVVFSSWHAETGNSVHVLNTNRDINYHGGADYGNNVVVERCVYDSGSSGDTWRIVSPGGSKHPETDDDLYTACNIKNSTLFGIATGSAKADVIHAWDFGSILVGKAGTDELYGGKGDDIIFAGKGYEEVRGGGGSDRFVYEPGDGRDTILDFDPRNDVIVLNGFSAHRFSDVDVQDRSDGVRIVVDGETLVDLQGVGYASFKAANIVFNEPVRIPDYVTPSPTQPEEPTPVPRPDPQPEPTPTPVPGETYSASSANDTITGTSGDDTVLSWGGQLDSGDAIDLGAGFDTIFMRSGRFTFDSSEFGGLKGIDHLDMSTPGDRATIILDEAFLKSTDAGTLKITFSPGDVGVVDTSRLADGSFTVDWDAEAVTIALTSGSGNPSSDPDPQPEPEPQPDPAPEPVVISKPQPLQEGEVNGIDQVIYSSSTTRIGTALNDRVSAWEGQLDSGDVADLGEGYDTLLIRNGNPNFVSDDFPGFTGVDHLDITASAGGANVVLGSGFVGSSDNGQVTISFGNDGMEWLDTSALDHDATDVFLYGGGDVFLSDGDDEVTMIEGARGQIHAGGGDDVVYGDVADDVLYGDGGMDFLCGDGGNDVLTGGAGADRLHGGAGFDTFRYMDIGDAGDIIQGFEAGDRFDVTELLAANGYGSVDEALESGALSVAQNGAHVTVGFTAGTESVTLATVENASVDDLLFTGTAII
ncbi:MAG: hypothetical protein EOM26_00085 [Alphaproteobacteria bacterium]|nr:hypothetical protein [Alphaproteobacteria bacterium]